MDMDMVPLTPKIDLSITKVDSDDPLEPGDSLSYTLTARNHGPSDATGVIVSDILPEGVTFVSATPVETRTMDGKVIFEVGNLASGQTRTFTVNVRVNDDFFGTLLNEAWVEGNETETRTDNNHDEEETEVLEPVIDLQIVKVDSDDPVKSGDSFSYTLTARNNGPFDATGVEVSDILPERVTFLSATPVETRIMGDKVIFEVGDLAVGQSRTFTINVRVDDDFFGTLLNEAWIDGNERDTNPNNNHDDEPTVVLEPIIDLAITKVDSADPVDPGSVFSYLIQARNNGPNDATGVVVSDDLPDDVAFQSASLPHTVVDGKLMFNVGDLAVGETWQVTINVQVDNTFEGTLLNEVWIAGDQTESTLANNHDEEPTVVRVEPTAVSGTVFVDRNANGKLDAGEDRIPNVLITLSGVNFRGQNVNRTTTTNSSGFYAFTDLMPGTYSLKETQPATYLGRQLFDGEDEVGDNGDGMQTGLDGFRAPKLNADDDFDPDRFDGVSLLAGANGSGYNFGELMHGLTKRDFIHELVWNF
jgi:uncharacterized repeat protein (TIGR01451 family)